MNSTSMVSKDQLEFDPSLSEDERKFYKRAYLDINVVRNRKVHCTVCKMHIGTAPSNESIIRMHPILRVTHCKKCHEFYNSGEFSKGEDGSELYCRWCGQGGEVYCCSNCPYVFCKSCIISNLSRGVVADIEQNENWSCFNCSPKMLWPLRAQHWALIKFIDKQKKAILNSNLSDAEIKTQMMKDRSTCCKIKKNSGYGSDSSNSSDISLSRLKQKVGEKRSRKSASKEDLSRSATASPASSKKAKNNDEVVCTPDVMSMLEPECQLTVPANSKANPQPPASSPKIMSIPQPQPPKHITPPPSLVVRNVPSPQVRPLAPAAIIKKTIVGPRMPASPAGDFSTPVYHTINGFRIDLNSAAQQETVRLPNGKLIQVKRQGSGPQTVTTVQSAPNHSTPTRVIHNTALPTASPVSPILPTVSNQQIVHSSGGHIIRTQLQSPRSITVQNPSMMPQFQQHQQPPPQHQAPQQYQQITIRQPNQQIATIRYQGAPIQQGTSILQNGTVQLVNGTPVTTNQGGQVAAVRQMPQFLKQFFPNTPLGLSRTQLQNQIFSAMEICQHLMGKVQTLTNSNAYKTAKSLTDVKELYIHLSYLLSYAIGRFKGLQDNCLTDMRDLGFTTDANSLENGQLAAGMDMVRSGKIKDFVNVDLDSFHDLIVRNMDLMKNAAVDSSTKDGKIDMRVEEDGKLRQYDYGEDMLPKYEDNDCQEKLKTGMESEYFENAPSPEVQIIEDDDEECLLVETSKKSPGYKSDDEIFSNSGSDDEDNLLVQIGERASDCESDTQDHASAPRPPITQISDDEDEDVEHRFSTSYEIDGDYKSSSKGKSSSEMDAKVIEIVKKYPELWDPDSRKTNPNELHRLWKKISKKLPRSANCRGRWRNIKYRYLKYLQRLEENESGEHIPPPANADLLKFLDKLHKRANTTTNTTANVTLDKSTKSQVNTADDHEFLLALISAIKKYPSIWHPDSVALKKHTAQPEVWLDIYNDLKEWGHGIESLKRNWKTLRLRYTRKNPAGEPYRHLMKFLQGT